MRQRLFYLWAFVAVFPTAAFVGLLRNDPLEQWLPEQGARDMGGWYLKYNGAFRIVDWTLERLTADALVKEADRAGLTFTVDPYYPAEFRPSPTPYHKSSFDLGHSACAANHQLSAADLRATFTTANIMPQCPELNRVTMRNLETYCRTLTKSHAVVLVFTASVFHSANKTLCCARLGDDAHYVYVPTHTAKSVCCLDSQGRVELIQSWLLKNTPDVSDQFDDSRVTTDYLESVIGRDLWSATPDEIETKLEAMK